jgi:hypothetical protein
LRRLSWQPAAAFDEGLWPRMTPTQRGEVMLRMQTSWNAGWQN